MKTLTLGTFSTRNEAEKFINFMHNEHSIDHDDISYVYKNTEGQIVEEDSENVSSSTPAEGAVSGAKIGGTIGAIAGLATVAGVIPVIGPIFAAGPIAALLGLTGAVGTTAAAAVTGAAAGGIIGALANLGIGEESAKAYSDEVDAGQILVTTYTADDKDVTKAFEDHGARHIETVAVEL